MTTVYRVQANDGRGPWRYGWSQSWIEEDACVGRLTETIMDLVPIETLRSLPPTMHYGCACRSLADLMAWFTPLERQRLDAFGYKPVALTADVVLAESQTQMLIGRYRPFRHGIKRLLWRETEPRRPVRD